MNKKYFYLVLFFLLAISVSSYAQVVKAALIGGMNLSQVEGDEVKGFKRVGAHVGAAAIVPFTERWSLTLETLFSMEGSRQKSRSEGNWYNSYDSSLGLNGNPYNELDSFYVNGAYDLHLNYVRVPVLFHYNDKNFALGTGLQYGRLVGIKEKEQDMYNTTSKAEEAYNKNDLSILADARVHIYGGLYFNVRYSYSLLSIRERAFRDMYRWDVVFTRKQYNSVLTFRLMWVINDGARRTIKTQSKETNPL